MRNSGQRGRKGYTLVELALAVGVGMMVAAMSLMLFNQQVSFIRIFRAQDFLTKEAPLVNNYMGRVVGAADGYALYETIADLNGGSNAVLTNAKVIMLRFAEADGNERAAVVSYETFGGEDGLYFRLVPDKWVPGASASLGDPDWAISKQPANVVFNVEQGILRMMITGPNGEEITYSGTQQL